jgi:hypothetical protein
MRLRAELLPDRLLPDLVLQEEADLASGPDFRRLQEEEVLPVVVLRQRLLQ